MMKSTVSWQTLSEDALRCTSIFRTSFSSSDGFLNDFISLSHLSGGVLARCSWQRSFSSLHLHALIYAQFFEGPIASSYLTWGLDFGWKRKELICCNGPISCLLCFGSLSCWWPSLVQAWWSHHWLQCSPPLPCWQLQLMHPRVEAWGEIVGTSTRGKISCSLECFLRVNHVFHCRKMPS